MRACEDVGEVILRKRDHRSSWTTQDKLFSPAVLIFVDSVVRTNSLFDEIVNSVDVIHFVRRRYLRETTRSRSFAWRKNCLKGLDSNDQFARGSDREEWNKHDELCCIMLVFGATSHCFKRVLFVHLNDFTYETSGNESTLDFLRYPSPVAGQRK